MPVIASLWLQPSAAMAQLSATSDCDVQPRYLQIQHNFPWSKDQQMAFSNAFSTGCVGPSYLSDITALLAQKFDAQGIMLAQISIIPNDDDKVISVRVNAKAQDVIGPEMTVLLPLRPPSTGMVITALEILGTAQEDAELVARYAVNEAAYQEAGGRLRLQWLRDGAPIAGATKSRYQLQRADVGAFISAELVYEGENATVTDSRNAKVKATIIAANYPPRIENLTIIGTPQTGEELVAQYQFIDDNEGDSEGDTRFIWLRDNIAIPEADKAEYQLGAKDIGAQITVRVEPQSQDGQKGQARSASLSQTIRERPLTAATDVVENIILDDANRALDVTALADAITTQEQADAKADKIVSIARPAVRPAPPAKKDVSDITDVLKEAIDYIVSDEAPAIIIAEEPAKDEVRDADKPAIIIDDADEDSTAPSGDISTTDEVAKDDVPVLLSEPDLPPLSLTPGFDIAASSPKTFQDIAFSPSAILLGRELRETRDTVLGTPITLEAMKSVLDAVNALYVAKGFELSRALLPEQLVTDGVVQIQLVEATVGKITLENRADLSEEFVLAHLAAKEGEFISLKALEQSIRTYNLSNKSKLATELAPGADFGQTDIFVDVAEPDKVELPSVSINNYANQTSDWRQNSFSITMNNLIGRDDETALSFSDSSGSTSVSGSFSMPLDNKGRNISLALSNSDTKIVAGSEETVGYRGSASSFGATFSQPVYFGDDYSLYLSASYGVSKSDLVQPVTGDLLSKSEVRKYSLATPYSYNNGTTAISVSPSIHALNIVTKIPEREKWMSKFDINANASHFLSEKWTLNGRAKFLYSDARDMINMPSEILSVGGPSSVRAYQPGESSGYQGYFVSGELRTDLANWEEVPLPDFMPSAQPYFFVDHIMAQSQYKVRSRADYWSGYGVGLQIPSIFNLLTFDVYWSEPLDGAVHEEEKEFYDDELFQFSLSARFRLQ